MTPKYEVGDELEFTNVEPDGTKWTFKGKIITIREDDSEYEFFEDESGFVHWEINLVDNNPTVILLNGSPKYKVGDKLFIGDTYVYEVINVFEDCYELEHDDGNTSVRYINRFDDLRIFTVQSQLELEPKVENFTGVNPIHHPDAPVTDEELEKAWQETVRMCK